MTPVGNHKAGIYFGNFHEGYASRLPLRRLCRTVKYEEVYWGAYSDGWEAEISLTRFLWRYGHVRPHIPLGGKTHHEVYSRIETYSSRPGLSISGANTVQ